MPRIHGPLFDKFLSRRERRRKSDIDLQKMLEDESVYSETNSYQGTPCREWPRAHRGGYGRLWDGLRLVDTHVLSYELFVGRKPQGHHVLHHCDNPSCWEPSHLWTGTVADNMRDKMNKGRGGHEKMRGRKQGPSEQRGARHVLSKLTEAKVRRIKMLAATNPRNLPPVLRLADRLNISALARELEVSDSLVRGILSGRNWAWLS